MITSNGSSISNISDVNYPPTTNAGPDQIIFDTLVLDGSQSYDPDDDPLTFQWEIKGITDPCYTELLTGEAITLTDIPYGFYNVTLTVTDSEGASATDDMLFSATGIKGDFDMDGDVDGEDLMKFSENYGG